MVKKVTKKQIVKRKEELLEHKGNTYKWAFYKQKERYDYYKCIEKKRKVQCTGHINKYIENDYIVYYSHSKFCDNKKRRNLKIDVDKTITDTIVSNNNELVLTNPIIKYLGYYDINKVFEQIDNYEKLASSISQGNLKMKSTSLILPTELNSNEIKRLHDSVIMSFNDRNLKFSDDLIYSENINKNIKYTSKELNTYDKLIYYKAKQRMLLCNYAPIEIVKNSNQGGYVVKATNDIDIYTLICEYSGKVDYRANIKIDNDSLMGLANNENDEYNLDIIPNEVSNIARFISGINNISMKHMQNVRSIQCTIDGSPHIILYSDKRIKKGYTLYYNYNEGNKYNPYDTSYFNGN